MTSYSRGLDTRTGARNISSPTTTFRSHVASPGMRYSNSYNQTQQTIDSNRDFNSQFNSDRLRQNERQDFAFEDRVLRNAFDHVASTQARYKHQEAAQTHGNNMEYLQQTQQGDAATKAMDVQSNAGKYASDERIAGMETSSNERVAGIQAGSNERVAGINAYSNERVAGINAEAGRKQARIQAHGQMLSQFLQPSNFRYW